MSKRETLDLSYENNRLATQLFGQFDQHLAMLEKMLGVEAVARGNHVHIAGEADAVARGRAALDHLYSRLEKGEDIDQGDVTGAIRMAIAEDQLSLPTMEGKGKLAMAQIGTRKKLVQARTKTQDRYIRAMDKAELIFGVGPAGTGKTYLAVAYAAALLERGAVDRIILSRPAVEAGERLGFLPGDLTQKVDPYLRPLYDALYDLMGFDRVAKAFERNQLEIAPLAFMRGRTLNHAFVILDEAQNTTPEQMKMFLTRIGFGARAVLTGDVSQIDLPKGTTSGLIDAERVLKRVPGIAFTRFTSADVVRHPLVARIVDAYDAAGRTVRAGAGKAA